MQLLHYLAPEKEPRPTGRVHARRVQRELPGSRHPRAETLCRYLPPAYPPWRPRPTVKVVHRTRGASRGRARPIALPHGKAAQVSYLLSSTTPLDSAISYGPSFACFVPAAAVGHPCQTLVFCPFFFYCFMRHGALSVNGRRANLTSGPREPGASAGNRTCAGTSSPTTGSECRQRNLNWDASSALLGDLGRMATHKLPEL